MAQACKSESFIYPFVCRANQGRDIAPLSSRHSSTKITKQFLQASAKLVIIIVATFFFTFETSSLNPVSIPKGLLSHFTRNLPRGPFFVTYSLVDASLISNPSSNIVCFSKLILLSYRVKLGYTFRTTTRILIECRENFDCLLGQSPEQGEGGT